MDYIEVIKGMEITFTEENYRRLIEVFSFSQFFAAELCIKPTQSM